MGMVALFLGVCGVSCQKDKDPQGQADDPRLQRPYCNDPQAVNYNWDFPGVPDNSLCFYPTEVFEGRYSFEDTQYYSAEYFPKGVESYTLELEASDQTRMVLKGFCSSGQGFTLRASRFYRATLDSMVLDSLSLGGQLFCGTKDTLSGYIQYLEGEPAAIQVRFRQGTDTNAIFHTGTAYRLP